MKEGKEITEKEKSLYEDILREICSFGAGNAAARLSKMVDKKVKIDLPEVWISRPAEGFPFLPKEKKEVVIGINSTFGGDRRGMIFVLMGLKEAKKLLGFVFNKEIREIGEMEESALLEISNIISGAVVGSIANFAGMKIILKPPKMTIDLPLSIIDPALAEQMETIKWIFFTVVSIRIEIEKISILLTFFPFFDLVGEVWKKMGEGKLP
jgi:chemotaxis protein CheC